MYICRAMHFISETRYNPRTQCDDYYLRIKESFRDLAGRPSHRLMLSVGFIDEELGLWHNRRRDRVQADTPLGPGLPVLQRVLCGGAEEAWRDDKHDTERGPA